MNLHTHNPVHGVVRELPEEILLLVGNETEDYFLLKKESRRKGSSR